MSNIMEFNFYSDPAHGWLAVDKNLLRAYGVHKNISTYSYQSGNTAYLEEDCDAGQFLRELDRRGIAWKVNEIPSNGDSFVRGYRPYKA